MTVSLKPEILEIAGIHIPNSFFTALIITILLVLFFAIYTRKITVNPRSRLQLMVESIVTGLHSLAEGIMGKKTSAQFFPFVFTFFILILFSNLFGLLPISGAALGFTHHADEPGMPILVVPLSKSEESHESISEEIIKEQKDHSDDAKKEESGVKVTRDEEIHATLLRSPSADLNFTIALAIISFILIEYAGLKYLGLAHLGKFFDYRVTIGKGWKIIMTPFMFLINVLWKTLELVLELARIISFSFRLFGNIFAGEVLLLVITTLTYGVLTLPFLGLELFVSFLQSVVFIFLTMVFIKVGTEHAH
jgi:F-type H+-transporting ATPase subunit a